jgi:hypothetical protein
MKIVRFEDGLYAIRRWRPFQYEYLWISSLFSSDALIWDSERNKKRFIEYATTADLDTAKEALDRYRQLKYGPKRGAGVPV